MWVLYSLLAAMFFAAVHVLDSYCVDDIFDRPWIGGITSAMSSFVALIPLLFYWWWAQWPLPPLPIVGIALLAGILIQASQFLYFQALSHSESGIVAAYWNLVPLFVLVLSYIFFREVLAWYHYVGIAVIIGSSVGFCLIDENVDGRMRTILLMGAASALQAIMFLLEAIVFNNMPYLFGFMVITIGLIIAGLSPLAVPACFRFVMKGGTKLFKARYLFFGIELINLVALAFSQRAVSLGIPSFVSAVESTIPAHAFLLSLIAGALIPVMYDKRTAKQLPTKFALVVGMVVGIVLIT